MPIDTQRIGRRLTEIRKTGRHSMLSVATRTKLARSYLYRLESGEVPSPGVKTLDTIATALGVTLAEVIGGGSGATQSVRVRRRAGRTLPPGLAIFVTEWERQRPGRMATDVIRSLAAIRFRGRRPRSPEDWRFIHDAIARCV